MNTNTPKNHNLKTIFKSVRQAVQSFIKLNLILLLIGISGYALADYPKLSSSSPANNATGVAVNSNIVLTFSKNVFFKTGDITIKKTSDNSLVERFNVYGYEGYGITGNRTTTVTINPTKDLSANTEYYILIDPDSFDDSNGKSPNSYAGISSTTALSFTTVDTTSPTISSTTVASDNSTIEVTFSEAVFNANADSGSLEVGDFALSLTGGTATLLSATPSSISISGNVYTLDLSLSGVANGSETITVVPSSSTAIYDGAGNAASTSQSNNTATLNRTPGVTNSSTTATLGEAGTATYTVKLNTEPTGSVTITPVSGDTGVATVSGVLTFTTSNWATPQTVTITGVSDADATDESVTITHTVAGSDYASVSSADVTASVTDNGTAALPSPLNKVDVVSSLKAWSNSSSEWASGVFNSVDNRLSWLSRNKDKTQTSHQGIKIHFENEVIEAVMNTTPRSKASIVSGIKNATSASKAFALLQDTEGALVASVDGLKTDTQAITINEAARLRADVIGTLNPTFGTVMNDWSVWTAGQVTVGDIKATSTASKQELDSQTISIGFDKLYNTDDLVGVMLSLGKSDTDIGTSTSKVESDNYALSSYGVFKQENDLTLEAVFGLGHLKFDTTRKDGTDNLIGKRNANQVFASATLRDKAVEYNNWSISPYGKLALAHTTLNSFSESGGATALTFDEQTINDAKVFIGADMNYLVVINNGTIKPFVKLEYGADVSDSSSATMHYNSESTKYTLKLEDKATSNWKLGLGADLITRDGLNGSIAYRREQAINTGHSDSLSFDVKLKF